MLSEAKHPIANWILRFARMTEEETDSSLRQNDGRGNGFFAALRMTSMRMVTAALPASKVFKVVKVVKDLKVICGQSRQYPVAKNNVEDVEP